VTAADRADRGQRAPDAGAVRAAFRLPGGQPTLHGPVARGFMGRIWRLDTDAGAWAVKESLAGLDRAHARVAAAFETAAAAAGVPLPEPVLAEDGDPVRVVAGRELRCHRWVDLAELDTGLDPELLGGVLARLHRVRFEYPGSADPWYSAPVGTARWDELITATRRAPFGDRLSEIRGHLLATETLLRSPAALQTCHRDLFADNVRAAGDGLCVFDWENCGEAEPVGELGMVLFEYTRDDPARTAALYREYRDTGGPAQVTGPESFGMVIAVIHHIGEISIRRWLAADEADDDAERELNLGRVSEFLEEPLTVDLINDLVDGARG
jgi:aminoglycoside phosphotransferase (APT) family kinase protein